ncbi:MAG: cadherin domain-containing protein [Pseudomonadales bacterium]
MSESASIGDAVGITASATDADTPDTVTYTLDDDASGLFAIDLNTGVVTVSSALDYETATSHNITVRATSTDGSFNTVIYNVGVSDENDTAPVVTPGQTFNVNEDAGVGDPVGTAVATDADTVGSLQGWTIVGGNADGVFQIDSATGAITIADDTNLNYEATNQYSLMVQVSDGASSSLTQAITIDINDVNEAPVFITAPVTAATEDLSYTYAITTLDVDGDGVTISGVTVPAWLTLTDNGDGTATLSGTPSDAEVGPHSIELQVSDGSLTSNQNFTLTVANINDDPVFTSANAFNVSENSVAVGTVTTTDVDGGAPQYTLVGAADDGLFNIDINTGALSFNAAADFESPADGGGDNIYNITVQVDDGAGGVVTQNIAITVTNVDEFDVSAILDSDAAADTVSESSSIGDTVGITASATDADTPDTVTYTLDDDASGLFAIDLNSGVVTVNSALDYETATSHNITVRATSTDGSFSTVIYNIGVSDENDTAPVITPGQTFNVNEDAGVADPVGTAVATDADTVGSLQGWTIVGGNADGVFQIDGATGAITIANTTNLNFEASNQYTLTLQVGDGSNVSTTETVVVDINDVNEAPTFASAPITSATEDVAYSYLISTNDQDGNPVTITDITLPAWLTLVDNGDGTATLSGNPTNAEVGPHSVTLQVSDGSLTSNQNFTLTVANVNDDPVFTSANAFNVLENATTVGTVTTTDVDGGAPQYSLVGVVDDGLFNIDMNTGALTFAAAPNFESPADVGGDNVYNLTVQVDDGAGGIVTQNVSVTVSNVNEFATSAITDADGTTDSVSESASIGTVVGITASATDADAPDTVTYTLDDDAGGLFAIDLNSGVVTVSAALDYESATSHNITVRASSTDGSSTTQAFTIGIGDVNDNLPVVTPAQNFSINEDAVLNDVVGTVLATDLDTVGSLQGWSIVGGNTDGIFQIDAATGVISIADPSNLDFESTNQYTLAVQVGDGSNVSASESVVIDINDVNEVPTFTSAPLTAATEDLLYSYTITTSDVDGDALAITDTTLPAWLTLVDNGDGTATLSGTPGNAEVGPHTIELQVSDGALVSTQNFTLTVTNVNDDPVFTSLNAFVLAENIAAVGTVTTADVDGGAPQYTLVGAVDDSLFSIDVNSGALSFNAAPDYDTPGDLNADNIYNLTVQVDDGAGGVVTQNVSVTITNIDEFDTSAVSDSDPAADSVSEDASIGSTVGVTAFADDADAPDSVTYSLDDDAGGRFDIDSNTGVVTLNAALDYELATSHDITVRAQSTDGSSSLQVFTIAVGDVNDTAPVVTPAQTFNINEDAVLNDVVGTVLATDQDTVGSLQGWNIVAGNTDGVFQIDAVSGAISIADPSNLNFESANQYTLTVQVGDGINLSVTETVVVDINDVNEAPTFVSAPVLSATEDLLYSYTITTNDVDGDALTITDVTLPAWLTLVDNGDGTATLSGTPSNAEVGAHNIELQVSDGILTGSQNFTLTVANVNDAPVITSPNTFNVAENVSAVGTITSSDVDGGAPQYTLVGANDDGLFSVDVNTGALSFNAAPDFESPTDSDGNNVYDLTIQVDDGAGGVVTQNVAVTITNVNEHSTTPISDTDASVDVVAEDAAIGSIVGFTAFADDADAPDTITYSLDDDAGGRFAIDALTGVVTVNAALDYEAASSHSITVRATSTDGSSSVALVNLAVADVNEGPQLLDLAGGAVDEGVDASAGYIVGQLTASDPDAGDVLTYSVIGGVDAAAFSIGGPQADALVMTVGALDFEVQSSYEVQVRVTDANGLFTDRTFTVTVNDLNDTPVAVVDSLQTFEDTALQINVATDLLVNDSDQDGDSLTLVSVSQPASGILIDNLDGTLTYMPDANFNGADQFQYQITDGNGAMQTTSVDVQVMSVNDAPQLVAPSSMSVNENATGQVLQVQGTDVDNEPVSLSITGGADAAAFQLDANSGALSFVTGPDFESPGDSTSDNRYELELTVTDGSGAFSTQQLQIDVADVNESPSLAPATFVSAEEFTGSIGTVDVSDPDSGDSLTLAITGGNAQAAFEIDSVTGEIMQNNPVAAGVYTLEVQVADAAGATSTGMLTISIRAQEPLIVGSTMSSAAESVVATTESEVGGPQKSFDSRPTEAASAVASEESSTGATAESEDSAEVATGTGSAQSDAARYEEAFAAQSELETPLAGDLDREALPSSTSNVIRGYEMLLEILFEEAEEGVALFSALADSAQSTVISAALSPSMLGALDSMRTDMDEQQREAEEELQLVVKSGTVATLSLTAGFVTWLLRTGSLLATALSTSPLWRTLDPIPVLAVLDEDNDDLDLPEERS